jgi:hypothetical protein
MRKNQMNFPTLNFLRISPFDLKNSAKTVKLNVVVCQRQIFCVGAKLTKDKEKIYEGREETWRQDDSKQYIHCGRDMHFYHYCGDGYLQLHDHPLDDDPR